MLTNVCRRRGLSLAAPASPRAQREEAGAVGGCMEPCGCGCALTDPQSEWLLVHLPLSSPTPDSVQPQTTQRPSAARLSAACSIAAHSSGQVPLCERGEHVSLGELGMFEQAGGNHLISDFLDWG